MPNQPTPSDEATSANIPVERSSSFQHVFADQASCNWLDRGIDLSFYTFTENYRELPGPSVQQGKRDVSVHPVFSETARVRLAPSAAWYLLTNIIFTLMKDDDLDPEAIKQEVDKITAVIDAKGEIENQSDVEHG